VHFFAVILLREGTKKLKNVNSRQILLKTDKIYTPNNSTATCYVDLDDDRDRDLTIYYWTTKSISYIPDSAVYYR